MGCPALVYWREDVGLTHMFMKKKLFNVLFDNVMLPMDYGEIMSKI